MELNKQLSEPYHTVPLEEGEQVVFVTHNHFKLGPDGKPRKGSGIILKGEYVLHDKYNGNKPIKCRNITGWQIEKLPSGEEKEVPVVSKLKFDRSCQLVITANDNETYAWMKNHPNNGTNPNRPKDARIYFFELDARRQANKLIKDVDVQLDAMNLIREATSKQISAIADAVGVNADKSVEEIRHDLILYAQRSPRRIIQNGFDEFVKLKLQLKEAETLNLIRYSKKDREWYWQVGKRAGETLALVPADKEPLPHLLDAFKSEKGKQEYKYLIGWFNKMNRDGAKPEAATAR